MVVRPQLGAGKERGRVDQVVEIVDDNRAMLLEKCVPRRGRPGELAGVGDDVFLGALRAAGAQNQDRFAVGDGAVEGGGETSGFLWRRFEVASDHVDLRTV